MRNERKDWHAREVELTEQLDDEAGKLCNELRCLSWEKIPYSTKDRVEAIEQILKELEEL